MLIRQALQENKIRELSHLTFQKSEYTFGHSRWDFLLELEDGTPYLLEVKSVTLAQYGEGFFPDAPTTRGKKHVEELITIQLSNTHQTGILFVCQRPDVQTVKLADWIDPKFSQAMIEAKKAGVEIRAVRCKPTLDGIFLLDTIPVVI
jgi:sugar fermentation stimulation protein A